MASQFLEDVRNEFRNRIPNIMYCELSECETAFAEAIGAAVENRLIRHLEDQHEGSRF